MTPKNEPPKTRIISIGGGKGGVGKSIVSSNLAVAMSQLGHRVVLADLDLGAANQHLLLGVDRPRPGIETLLSRDIEDPREGLSPTKFPRLQLCAGTGAKLGAANITHAEKLRIIRRLRALDADVVLVDVGAGVGYNVLDFFELGAQRLVVTTPQVTAIHDAYSFLKSAVLRTLQHTAERNHETAALEPATSSGEAEKVVDLLARIRLKDPVFADRVFYVLEHFGAHLVGNQLVDPGQLGIFQAIAKMMKDYLGITVPILGWLRTSPAIAESVNQRKPIVMNGNGELAKTLRTMAEALLVEDVCDEEDLLLEEEGVAPPEPKLAPSALEVKDEKKPAAEPPRASSAAAQPKARVYQPPPRKRKPEQRKRPPALVAEEGAPRRKRRITLPGLTPNVRSR